MEFKEPRPFITDDARVVGLGWSGYINEQIPGTLPFNMVVSVRQFTAIEVSGVSVRFKITRSGSFDGKSNFSGSKFVDWHNFHRHFVQFHPKDSQDPS